MKIREYVFVKNDAEKVLIYLIIIIIWFDKKQRKKLKIKINKVNINWILILNCLHSSIAPTLTPRYFALFEKQKHVLDSILSYFKVHEILFSIWNKKLTVNNILYD